MTHLSTVELPLILSYLLCLASSSTNRASPVIILGPTLRLGDPWVTLYLITLRALTTTAAK
eukprot:IDg15041t1